MAMRYIQKGIFVKKPCGADFTDCYDSKFHILFEPQKDDSLRFVRKVADRFDFTAVLPLLLVRKLYRKEMILPGELDHTGLKWLTWDERKLTLHFISDNLTPAGYTLHLYEVDSVLVELYSREKLLGLPAEKPKKKKWQFWLKDDPKETVR